MQTLIVECFSIAITLCALCLFGTAGFHKLNTGNRDFFKGVIDGFMLPSALSHRAVLVFVALVELSVVLLSILPATHSFGMKLAALVVAGYALVMAQALIRGARNIQCGCAGPGHEAPVSPALIYRNIVLAMAFVFASTTPISGELAPTLIAIALALILTMLHLSIEQLLNNHAQLTAIKQVRKL